MITLWKGSANTWDCDEMGHMNVRVYVEKIMEGIAAFAHTIEMPQAFQEGSQSTLIPVDQHIRFIREVHPGRPLHMQGCVLDIGENDVLLYQELRHSDGRPAAAFRTRLVHARSKSAKPFAWNTRTRAALEALIGTAPADTAPRSIQPDGACLAPEAATLETVKTANAPLTGMGAVTPSQCDLNGRMRTEWFMGRISDSVPNLLYEWRTQVAAAAGDKKMGAAVLEYRMIYRNWPRAGDLYQAYSSLARAEEKFHTLVHWLVNPATGKAWLTSEAVAVTFDLQERKLINTPAEHIDMLETLAPRGLKL